MVRCEEFYQKWQEVPNWCEHCESSVSQIDSYLQLVKELEKEDISKEFTFVNLPEGAARPLFQEKDPKVKDIVFSKVRSRLKHEQERKEMGFKPDKITAGDVRKLVTEVKKELKGEPDLPTDKYRVIYCDPPWKYSDELIDGYGSATHHYETMSIEELCELSVSEIAQDDAVLFIWVTSPFLEGVFKIINAWGFEYKASFVWDKVKHNFGHYNSVRHELLLICTRGSCTPDHVQPTDGKGQLINSVQRIPRSDEHSEKPEEFRTIIDTLYSQGKRIELFARKTKEEINETASLEWEVWGDEISDAKAAQ